MLLREVDGLDYFTRRTDGLLQSPCKSSLRHLRAVEAASQVMMKVGKR